MHSRPGGGFIKAQKRKVLASQWPNQCLAHPSGAHNWLLASKIHISLSHIFKCLLPQAWPSANAMMLQRSIYWIFKKYENRVLSLTLPAPKTKSTFVHCHLAAITAHQNSFSALPHCVNGPRVGCEDPYTRNQVQRLIGSCDVADEISASFLHWRKREQREQQTMQYN